MFFEERNLFSRHLLFFISHLTEIQFISKCSLHCTDSSCLEWCHAMILMIRANRYVCGNRRHRIAKGSTVLNTQSFNRIRIIATPDLRTVIQHTCIKPSTAATASFQQKFWESLSHSFQYFIKAKHITMSQFPLTVTWKLRTVSSHK